MPEPIDVYGAAVVHDGCVLLARRTRPASLAGLFEFPGGKREPGEEPRGCLVRELQEELAYGVSVGRFLGTVLSSDLDAAAPGPLLRLTAYSARPLDPSHGPRLVDGTHDKLCWVNAAELRELADADELAPMDVPLVPAVVAYLHETFPL